MGRDRAVGIATGYSLDGPGNGSRWRRDFQHPSRPNLGFTHPPIQRVPRFPEGKAAGTWHWVPTPSNADLKERVELYLYSPSGSSWPVLGWTVTFYLYLYWFDVAIVPCFMSAMLLKTRQAMYVNRDIEARSRNNCCRGKASSIAYPEFVFAAWGIRIQCAYAVLSSVTCPAPLYAYLQFYLINDTIFEKNNWT
jgi:hypothetical protein